METAKIAMMYDEFKWIEFSDDVDKPVGMIEIGQLQEMRAKYGDGTPLFISRYLFNRPSPYYGPILSNFYMDFDSEKDTQRALSEAWDAVQWFVQQGVELETIKIRFTGGKGASIEVPFGYFDAKPSETLNEVWKKMTEYLKKLRHYVTADLVVYDRRRKWRVTNTKHKSGCFKIPLTHEELKLPIADIRAKAQAQVPYKWLDDRETKVKPIALLRDLIVDFGKQLKKDSKEFVKKFEKNKPEEFDESAIFPCVLKLIEEGVSAEKFQREPTAFNIAVALSALGADRDFMLEKLKEFADHCDPPMGEARYPELEHAIDMVEEHEYSTHCGTPCFAAACIGKGKCWVFAKKVKPSLQEALSEPPEEYTDAEVAAGRALLESPNIIEQIEQAFGDIVMEQNLAMSIFAILAGTESVQVGGESATGKNFITDCALECFPRDWIKTTTGASGKALAYLGDYTRILYIKETQETGKPEDSESSTEFHIKLMLSEKKLTQFTTIRDPATGRWTVMKTETVFDAFVTTSTNVSVPIQLQNRIWEVSTRDDINIEVVTEKARRDTLPTDLKPNKTVDRRVVKSAMEILDKEAPKKVIIPYAEALIQIFEPLQHMPRIRRDYDKLSAAIKCFARLAYKQRPILTTDTGSFIIAMPQDLAYMFQYMAEATFGTFTERTQRSLKVWEVIAEILKAGKRLDATTLSKVLTIHRNNATMWLKKFQNEGLLHEGKRDEKGVPYFNASSTGDGTVENSLMTIDSDLIQRYYYRWYNVALKWLIDHAWTLEGTDIIQRWLDSKEERIFTLPYAKVIRRTSIADLPDAPLQTETVAGGSILRTRMTKTQLRNYVLTGEFQRNTGSTRDG